MKSIDKLRDLADDINAKEIVEHMQLYPNCVFDCHWLDGWHSEFNRLIESLEAEIAANYLELPKDADGVPIHVGDVMRYKDIQSEDVIVKGVCEDSFMCGKWANYTRCTDVDSMWHHVKPRTLEDVLRDVWQEALDYAKSDIWRNPDEVFAERADEIRELLLGGEGESDET